MTVGGVVSSSSALATLIVSHSILKKDPVLELVCRKLVSSLQLTLVEKKRKGHELQLQLSSGHVLQERNAIVRCLCSSAMHGTLDMSPLFLLGGHSITSKVSSVSAMALASITSWQSIADSIKHPTTATTNNNERQQPPQQKMVQSLLPSLNDHLTNHAFLIVPSSHVTLADFDLAIALANALVTKRNESVERLPVHVQRWMYVVHTVWNEYNNNSNDDNIITIEALDTLVSTSCSDPTVVVAPAFFYGTKDNYVVPATTSTTPPPPSQTKKQKKEKSTSTTTTAKQEQGQTVKTSKTKATTTTTTTTTDEFDISALDIRVGKIVKAWNHPNSDKLYCEEIDVGDKKDDKEGGGGTIMTRQVASGLRSYYGSPNDLDGRYVLVVCNLKTRKLGGFPSHGMVLCASNADRSNVQLIVPPIGSTVGERIVFDGIDTTTPPETEGRVAKKKIFETLAPQFQTNDDGIVVWKHHVAKTSMGIIAVKDMPNAQVS